MKKLLLSGCLLVGSIAFGQILSEDFESVIAPGLPNGWSTATTGTQGFYTGNSTDANSAGYWPVPAHTTFAMANDDACNCAMTAVYLETPSMSFTGINGVGMTYNVVDDGSYGGNPHSVEVSINGGSTWTNIYTHTFNSNVVWEPVAINLGAATNNQADVRVRFKYDDGGTWATGVAIDDVVIFALPSADATLTSIDVLPYSAAGNMNITGVIKNSGADPITAMDITWDDGTGPYTDMLTGLNIASGATYNFTHSTPLNVVANVSYTIDVDVALTGDANIADNSLSATTAGLTQVPAKVVVGEENTGTWCGWCPRGAVGLAGMEATSNFIGIAVHNGDPMVISAYDNGASTYFPDFTGYPNGAVDRIIGGDPSTFNTMHSQRINDLVPCDVKNITAEYNSSTGMVNVSADAEFYGNVSGNYRLSCIITQDDMVSSASGWSQTNYYSGGVSGTLIDPVSGFNWSTASSPVAASAFGGYDHVARSLSSNTFLGDAGSLPAGTVNTGVYPYTFAPVNSASMISAAAVPYDYTKSHAVVMVIDASTSEVLNAGSVPVSLVTAVTEVENNHSMTVFPNPTTDVAAVKFYLRSANTAKMEVYNTLGELVQSTTANNFAAGANSINFDGTDLNKGLYFVNLTIGNEIITRKVTLK
jgi:hypothetical protein